MSNAWIALAIFLFLGSAAGFVISENSGSNHSNNVEMCR